MNLIRLPTEWLLTFTLGAVCLWSAPARAQSPVTITLDPKAPGAAIPPEFSGLSFEMEKMLPDQQGAWFFSPTNQPLLTLFKTLGIRSLRVGGNTADRPTVKVPAKADIDSLFAFARAAEAKVIYTLRLREGDPKQAAEIAKYVLDHYKSDLTCFALGNEPNVFAKEYPVYRGEWEKYMETITAPGLAPGARFCGPSATPGKTAWARDFLKDFGSSGKIALISQHAYPGGGGNKVTDPAAARDKMLSPEWLKGYERFYKSFAAAALSNGLPYRLEEANNFFNGGAKDVSDTFAAALWALDYLHWWAAHHANGINFHTGDKVAAGAQTTGCRYATFWTSPGGYNVHPIGYGIKAFALGGVGQLLPAKLKAGDTLNFTAYGVLAPDKTLCVTLINKEHGPGARAAQAAIEAGRGYARGHVLFLTAPGGDVAAKTGVTLGASPIKDDGTWQGTWMPLSPAPNGQFTLTVPASAAAIVRLSN
jgi:hypothetical protein